MDQEIVDRGVALEVQGLILNWLGGPTDVWEDDKQHRIVLVEQWPDGSVMLDVVSLDRTEDEGRYKVRTTIERVEQ